LKDAIVYNRPWNEVFVKSNGNEIHIICSTEEQLDSVVERMQTDNCVLSGYEEWDEDEDRRWILQFIVGDDDMKIDVELN